MTEYGLSVIEAARKNGLWDKSNPRPVVSRQMPDDFRVMLEANSDALETFSRIPASVQRQYFTWIALAKRPETRLKRIEVSIAL